VRFVEPEELKAFGVSLTAGLSGHQVDPSELMGDTLEGELIREPPEHLISHQVPDGFGHSTVAVQPPVSGIAIVAAEQLVAAIAAEHHLHVPGSHLRQVEQADRERIGRLIQC
jgi:hypothetical protein